MTETPIPLSDIMNLDSFLTILWRISFAKIDDAFRLLMSKYSIITFNFFYFMIDFDLISIVCTSYEN